MLKFFLLSVFVGLSLGAVAQETDCSDGIDNDGDGFIDCYDSDCAGNAVCVDNYIGNESDCEIPQPPGSDFSMTLKDETTEHVTSTHGRFVIGDMGDPVNGKDGIPEVVTAHTDTREIFILDGQTLDIKYQGTAQARIDRYDIAIADVANNGCGRIFIAEVGTERVCVRYRNDGSCREYQNVTKHYVSSWDCEANQVWRREVYGRPFTFGLADFDADGKAELYYRNEILDAETGQTLIAGSGNWDDIDGGPVAVDILDDSECADCAGLELVAGGQIYAVNLNAPGAIDGGTLTLVREFNNIPGLLASNRWDAKALDLGGDQFVNSQTSIADFDQDGYLDVLMTGSSNSGKTSVFYWNVRNNTGQVYRPANNWRYGAGRLNLADVDGDGEMNVAFVTGNYLYALDENLALLWRIGIDEQSSGYTSTTVFDFNNDGASEIVYRDETYLYIIKGDGTFSPPIQCKSLTSNDYPVVADVDADGSTEICVVCQDNFNDNAYTADGEGVIRTFQSGNEPWVSSRKVWNQHGYFNVNINDDLTVPIVQQKHHVVFSTDKCGPGENRVLNSFLNQSAILNSDGCKTYPSADVTFVPNAGGELVTITPPQCPDQNFMVSFTIRNIGSLDINAVVPISFYNGDPELAGAVKLGTENITLSNFQTGDQIVVPDIAVAGTGGPFTLFVVLNDDGSSVPTPIVLPNTDLQECNIGNNIVSASVNPQAFQITTTFTDHVQCGVGPSPPNGSVRAYKLEGAVEQTVGYTFYWFDGTTAGAQGAADHTGSQVNNLPAGTYTVYATHDAYQCGSDTVQVTIGQQSLSINATVSVDHAYTNCNSPDGQLSVTPDNGLPGDYEYAWYEGTVVGTTQPLSTNNVLPFTEALTYSVLVTEIASGCETLESGTVPDQTVTPAVTTGFTPAKCAPPDSGEATASVGGVTAGYSFYWYDGSTSKPAEDFSGATYSGVTAGSYTVIAEDNTTGCRSDETVVTVTTVSGIAVSADITAQQTSCATPNGAASANVGGTAAGYSFVWYRGNNTVNQIGTGPVINGLAAGDYTVQATSLATGCSDTELVTIVDNIRIPTVTPSVVAHQVDCFPPDGSASATASGSPGPYIYYWFDGNIGTPDTTAADFKGSVYAGRPAGFYTVVAVDANTRCSSARGVVQVLDQTVVPVITTSTAEQTNCEPATPNGQASANVGGVTAGYKFRWFSGADTTTFLVQNAVMSGRAAGSYTVKAVNIATGCFSTRLVVINDISAKPALSLIKQDNSVCSATIGYTGSVTSSFAANPNAQPGDTYVYAWRKDGVVIPGETGPAISGLNAGTYEVTVRNQQLACVSDPVSIVVNDVTVLPALNTAFGASTNCIPSKVNGSAEVTEVNNVPVSLATGYTYQWHTGTGTGNPISVASNPTANDPELLNVQGGTTNNYTVLVTTVGTGCQNTATVLVPDASEKPIVTLTPADNTVCDPSLIMPLGPTYNGSVQVTGVTYKGVAFAGPGSLSYEWFNGVGTTTPNGSSTTATLSALDNGSYSAVVTINDLGCESDFVSAEVQDNVVLPALATSSTPSTNCVSGKENGSAELVTVDSTPAGGATGYAYQWHLGAGTGSPIGVGTNASADDAKLEHIQGGMANHYTLLVTNQSSGCRNTATVLVADASEKPVITLSAVDNTICDPSLIVPPGATYNGSVQVASVTYKGVPYAGPGILLYQWFNGVGTGTPNGSSTTATWSDLDNGHYSATVTIDDLGCESDFVSQEVRDDLTLPALTFTSTASTNCAGGTDNGTATVVAAGLAGQTFDFEWHKGAMTSGPFVADGDGGNTAAIVRQEGGESYAVRVTAHQTGCVSQGTTQIMDDSRKPVVTPLIFANNTNCTAPFNGTASVDGVTSFTYHGTTIGNPYTGFTLVWSGGIVNPAGDGISELGPGTYSLQVTAGAANAVTNNNDNCTSDPVSVVILDDFTYPQISTTIVNNQTSCDAASPNGQLEATETSGSGAYSFDWFAGTAVGPIGSGLTEVPGFDGRTTGVLASDDYTVLVTNTSTRCETTATVFLPENIVLPVVTLVQASPVTTCTVANGEITVIPTLTSSADGDFTVYYLNEVGNNFTSDPAVVKATATYVSSFNNDLTYLGTPVPTPGTTRGPGLAPGLYTALVRDEITHCESDAQTIRVEDNTVSASIAVDDVVAATFCATTNGNIDISVTGGTGAYTINWFDGGPTNPAPFVFINSQNEPVFSGSALTPAPPAPAPLTGEDIWNLAAGLYTVVVEDANGCGSVLSVNVPFQNAPVITLTPTNSTKCDPMSGNGALDLTVNTAGVAGATTYSYILKKGLNPATATYFRGEDCTNTIDDDGDGLPDMIDSECDISFTGVPDHNQSYTNLNPGDYLIEVIDHAATCSVFRTATVEVDALKPVVTIGNISPNTACDDSFADGSIEITISKDPLDKTTGAPDYRITSITAPVPSNATNPVLFPLAIADATATTLFTNPPFTFSGGFSDQTYRVDVVEVNSGCTVNEFVTIPNQPAIPDITLAVTDESYCAPNSNGRALVTAVTIGTRDEYEFTWYNNASLAPANVVYQANGTDVAPFGGELIDATRSAYTLGAAGQGAGQQTFYVRAQRLAGAGIGAGCNSPAVQVVIRDTHATPAATLASLPNTSCDPLTGEGSISISTVTNTTVGPVAAATYDYSISPDPLGLGVVADQSGTLSTPFPDLPDATYTVTAVNRISGCLVQNNITVSPNKYVIALSDTTIADKLICDPDGEIAVTEITIDRTLTAQAPQVFPAAMLATNFEFRWFKGMPGTFATGAALQDAVGPTVIDGEVLTIGGAAGQFDDPAPGLGAGIYYVIARQLPGPGRFGANCETAPLMVEIKDKSVDPVITLTAFSNTSCHPTTFEGQFEVDVADNSAVAPAPAFAYTYAWTALTPGRTAPDPSGNPYDGNSNIFTQVQDGQYALSATNTTTGCVSTQQVTLELNTTPIFVQSVISEAQLFCTPSGSLEVRNISYNDRAGATTNVSGAGLADFTFEWFRGGTAPANAVGGNTSMLDSAAANYPGIGADTQYYVVATRVNNTPGLDCSSAPFRVAIEDERIYPAITLTPFTNTSCHPATFEGEIEVDVIDGSLMPPVPGPSFTYSYAWTALTAGRAAPVPTGNPYDGNSDMFTQVQDGVYELSATNTTTGCASTQRTTIQQNTTPIFVQSVVSEAQLFCTPSGSLEVRNISYNDRTGASINVSGAGLADFSFEWLRGGTAAGNAVGGNSPVLDSAAANYPAIGADPDYYVVATRVSNAPGRDCSSAPFRVAIEDKREYPVLAFSTVSNTTCNDNFDASITLTASTAGLGSAANYNIDWTSDPGGFVSIADASNVPAAAPGGYTTASPDNIGVGTYSVTVANVLTQCASVASVTVLQNTTPVQIWDVARMDQTDCDPFNGSISIDTNDPTHVSVVGPYTFEWMDDGVPIAPAPTPDNILSGLDAGVYTVAGTKTSGVGAGCATAPFSITLLDLTDRPALELQSIANFACDPAQANGQLSVTIFEGIAEVPAAGYTLQWYAGRNVTSGPVLGSADVLVNQVQGDFTLVAVDNVSPNRGCDNSASIAIEFDETSFSVAVAATAQTLCAPGQNGSVAVTGIAEVRNGATTPAPSLAAYDYQWFDVTGTPHSSTPVFTNNITAVSNLLTGNYTVQVRNSLGCISTATAALVNDQTVLPSIALDNFANPAVCVLPETSGYLQVSADNNPNFSEYTFEWFEGSDDTGPVVQSGAELLNILYDQPLEYTVRVMNNSTHCVNRDTYRFTVDTVQIRVMASAVARTNCLADNGSLFATTLNGAGGLYDYEWYSGGAAAGTPVYTTREVSNVPVGDYTVIAVNRNHDFCNSTSYTARVTDARVYPAVDVVALNPLTHCDPANPNGMASASVNNSVVGYVFDWFQGGVGGAPLYTGPEVSGLTATTYVVRATAVLTGCDRTASILIENNPVNVQEPTVVVVSHLTNCVDPDGVLSASVNGNTANYTFQWYNGNAVRNQPDELGEFYRNLEDGWYATTATDNVSGCVSDPVITEVLPFQEIPEFDIATVPTHCEQDVGEAAVEVLNDVQVASIEWDINGVREVGARVAELPKGAFNVTVVTFQRCSETKTFVIEPEVLVFNGVSRNNDGENDFFEIACIQDFPQNNVKIFNRAGTLVYEANGYDNQDVFFDGVSNRGINLLGTDLPDGTYFYIIDKRNGSKPRTGYLELLR